eukprot:scaffold13182_cov64-Attheya_sp.AAC.2
MACVAWHTRIPHAYAPYMTGDIQTRHCDAALVHDNFVNFSLVLERNDNLSLSSGVVGINLGACARGPRAAESNEFQGWCGDELRQAYKNRFLSFESLSLSLELAYCTM